MRPTTTFVFVIVAAVVLNSSLLDRLFTKGFSVPPVPGATILVTGTSSGLGNHLARYLAQEGFVVFATVRRKSDSETWESYSNQVTTTGNVVPIIMDVASDKSVMDARVAIEDYLKSNSKLTFVGVVNNAGIHVIGSLRELEVDDYQRNFDANVFGVVRVTKTFLPLLSDGGRIVNIGSLTGRLTNKGGVPYSATKHALEAMSDSWRMELAPDGISVSHLQPGFLQSKICTNPEYCDDPAGLNAFVSAVHHALTSAYPRTRYAVGWVRFFPCWMAIATTPLLPDRIHDAVIAFLNWYTGGLKYSM